MGAAFLAGALAALAMPPLYWLPLAVLGIVAFVWLWQTAPGPRSALLRGWAWGIGHFAVGSYWILEAFFVPPADFALAGPPIVLGLAAILGFFPGAAAAAARWAVLRWPALGGRYRRLILLAIAWTVAEWLRGHVFTGYPWNPLGACLGLCHAVAAGRRAVRRLRPRHVDVPGPGRADRRLARPPLAALAVLGLAGIGGLAMIEAPVARRGRSAGPHRPAQHRAGGEVASRRPGAPSWPS